MRRHPFAAIAAVGMLAASLGSTVISAGQDILRVEEATPRPSRKKQTRRAMIAGGFKAPRSRGPQAKRKGKSNRNLISERVRRKHRRASK